MYLYKLSLIFVWVWFDIKDNLKGKRTCLNVFPSSQFLSQSKFFRRTHKTSLFDSNFCPAKSVQVVELDGNSRELDR